MLTEGVSWVTTGIGMAAGASALRTREAAPGRIPAIRVVTIAAGQKVTKGIACKCWFSARRTGKLTATVATAKPYR